MNVKKMKPWAYQHLRAPNSPMGNPQRLYVVYARDGRVLEVIDEGYRGLPATLRHGSSVVELSSIEIPRGEYHAWRRGYTG